MPGDRIWPVSIDRRNPEQLHAAPGYHHVTIADAGKWIFLAGQCPLTATGDLVGSDDIGAQVDQIAENTLAALAALAAAGPDDVVRTVIYVVSDSQPVLADVWNRFTASVIAPAFTTASTLLGVTQLGFSGQRVKLDVTAIREAGH
jgi:enamine deaminase RidA (YjgF/YER057c/UK114 family)